MSWVVEGIGGTWSRYVALVDVEAENRELRDDNERLRKQLAAMARRAYDVAALEDLAVVKKRTPADTLGARVIGAPLSPQFRVVRLRIDRGGREVAVDMPVITVGGAGRPDRQGLRRLRRRRADQRSRVEDRRGDPRSGAARGPGQRRARHPDGAGPAGLVRVQDRAGSSARAARPTRSPGQGRRRGRDQRPRRQLPGRAGRRQGHRRSAATTACSRRVEVEPAVDVSRVRAVMVLLAPPPPPDPDAKTRRRSEAAFGARPL